MNRRLPMRARLAVMYAAALLAALSITSAAVLWQQERIGIRRVDRELDALATTLANSMREEIGESHDPSHAAGEACGLVAAGGRSVAIADASGALLASRWNGPQLAASIAIEPGTPRTIGAAAGAWRVRRRVETMEDRAISLIVATPLSDVQRERRESREAMLVGIPIVFVLAAGGGLYLASISVRPIAVALDAERRFTADASHELRTPVSVIRATTDVALSVQHREEPEYREALDIIGRQTRVLGRLVQDMLVLARADAGAYPFRPVDLYLDELVVECRRAVEVLAAERCVSIVTHPLPETPYRGDEDLLRQLLLNVIQNAVQHARQGGHVEIALRQEGERLVLRVTNDGPGIPIADRERIFARFVQLDQSRRDQGAGLGLPIGRWIAERHGGRLFVESGDSDSTTFCLYLPSSGNDAS
jgi:signal transduction histidine kinase